MVAAIVSLLTKLRFYLCNINTIFQYNFFIIIQQINRRYGSQVIDFILVQILIGTLPWIQRSGYSHR
jgi:hypothetical protein